MGVGVINRVDSEQVRVRLLSGFAVTHGLAALELRPGAQRLIAFLALLERQVERKYAAFRLWPDKGEDRAMANLRSALWRVRQLPVALIDSTATHLRLDARVWVDARHGLDDVDVEGMWTDTTLAGELLPDWYDEWLTVERERLRQHRLHRLEAASLQLRECGRVGDAIDLALRAISLEPLRESAHRLVIEAHLLEGNVADATRQYRDFRRMLWEELGVEPSHVLASLLPKPCLESASR